jgi:hypothetical protein
MVYCNRIAADKTFTRIDIDRAISNFLPLVDVRKIREKRIGGCTNTTNPLAGFEIALISACVIRGSKSPLFVLTISRAADGTGVVVPIPTFPELLFEILPLFSVQTELKVVPSRIKPVPG